jgi:C2H2-type zinc finger/zinc-finger C2H2-type
MRPAYPGAEGVGFRCDFCGAAFPDLAALQRHLLAAHAGRPFAPRCRACGLAFSSPRELKAHNQTVHGAPID